MKKNIKRWSDWDVDFALENYGLIPDSEIANELGRSVAAVQVKVSSLRKISRSKPGSRVGMSIFSISEYVAKLAKLVGAIEARLDVVEKSMRDDPRTAVDKSTFIREHYRTMSRKQMADATGLTIAGVAHAMWRMGIKKYDKDSSPSGL